MCEIYSISRSFARAVKWSWKSVLSLRKGSWFEWFEILTWNLVSCKCDRFSESKNCYLCGEQLTIKTSSFRFMVKCSRRCFVWKPSLIPYHHPWLPNQWPTAPDYLVWEARFHLYIRWRLSESRCRHRRNTPINSHTIWYRSKIISKPSKQDAHEQESSRLFWAGCLVWYLCKKAPKPSSPELHYTFVIENVFLWATNATKRPLIYLIRMSENHIPVFRVISFEAMQRKAEGIVRSFQLLSIYQIYPVKERSYAERQP